MSFSKRQGNDANTSKSASKEPFPKSSQYNAEHYATLVVYPTPFHKYPEPFLCLIGISRHYTLDEDTYPQFLREMVLLSFIQTTEPTKVRVGERQRAEGEPKLLDTTVGRVVPLLPVAPARASSELEASVDMLFDKGDGGSHAKQGDSASGGHGVGIPQVSKTAEIIAEDAAPVQPRRQRKRKTRLLAGAVLNPKVGVAALPTLPFITSSVSVTPKREDGDQTDFMAEANLRTITAPPRPFVPLMTMTTTVTSMVDPTTTAKEKFVESSIFGGGSSSGVEYTVGGFSGLTGSDFIVGGIGTVVSPDTDLQKVYVPQWSVTNGSCLDDGRTCRMRLLAKISPSAEVRIRAEFNIREKRRLGVAVEEKNSLLKARDEEVANLTATVRVREQEVADLDVVVTSVKVHTLEVSSAGLQEKVTAYENFIELAIAKCLNSTEYLSSLGEAISKAVENGMQEGLYAGITHGAASRVLTDVAAYNLSAEADYLSALQPLTGKEVISAPIDTASTPSTTLASVSTITPVSIEDYKVVGMDGQEAVNESVPNDATGRNVNPFPNVDDVELNVS
ncbi:hypothetical protein Tco_1053553 [Tanacetum coccineum]|uniref:Transposase (Putative), gypsy type n=1 Tax=Tanacetum coccineum TaxID=301880 RepID=A0ABQ5GVG3_9ASTR